jgi:murein DD-endopeptidase MepM/ murein hydrolase activator NlpD
MSVQVVLARCVNLLRLLIDEQLQYGVDHLKTTFTPIDPIVKTGQFVKRNQIIGYVSTTGSHCKPQTCLHWGLIVEKRYLNPLSILTKPYPILLPILFD